MSKTTTTGRKIAFAVDGKALDEYEKEQQDQQRTEHAQSAYKSEVHQAKGHVDAQRFNTTARYSRSQRKWDLHDFQAKNSRTRHLNALELFELYGEDSLVYQVLDKILNEADKPLSINDLRERFIALEKSPPNAGMLRAMVRKLDGQGKVTLLRKNGDKYFPLTADAPPQAHIHVCLNDRIPKDEEKDDTADESPTHRAYLRVLQAATYEEPMCAQDVEREIKKELTTPPSLAGIKRKLRKLAEEGVVDAYFKAASPSAEMIDYPKDETETKMWVVWADHPPEKRFSRRNVLLHQYFNAHPYPTPVRDIEEFLDEHGVEMTRTSLRKLIFDWADQGWVQPLAQDKTTDPPGFEEYIRGKMGTKTLWTAPTDQRPQIEGATSEPAPAAEEAPKAPSPPEKTIPPAAAEVQATASPVQETRASEPEPTGPVSHAQIRRFLESNGIERVWRDEAGRYHIEITL